MSLAPVLLMTTIAFMRMFLGTAILGQAKAASAINPKLETYGINWSLATM